MKTIKLYGHLGKQFGKIHKYCVNTPAEAIKLLNVNYPGFEHALISFKGEGYRVIVGKEDIDKEDLCINTGQDTIKIVPTISGSGGGNGRVILTGLLLMAVSYFTFGVGSVGITGWTGATATSFGMGLTSVGMSLVLQGISSSLFTPPAIGKQSISYNFDGAVNTTRQGVPIAVGYGELIVGSAVISAGITTSNIAVV